MTKNNEGSEPPPQKLEDLEGLEEPENWDLPPVITEEDDSPDILEIIEAEEAIETIFTNIHKTTIISTVIGILFGIAFIVLERILPEGSYLILKMLIGFAAGLFLVFGASEIIILGVKGMSDKLNWNPYLEGLLQAIGAALAELIVVMILLIKSNRYRIAGDTVAADNMATTAIVLILATVIINIFFLGIAMIFVSRDKPFGLPRELTFYEANLILGMMVFSFVIMIYGLYFEFAGSGSTVTNYDQYFEIVIGIALILVYIFFLIILVTRFGKRTSTPQTLITEFFPDEDELVHIEPVTTIAEIRLRTIGDKTAKANKKKQTDKDDSHEVTDNNNSRRKLKKNDQKSHRDRNDALATLRRFPWIIIIALFLVGAGGIIWGGEILASSIEHGIERFETDVLVYAVIVGIVASSPELVVTMRGLLSKDKEKIEVGLVHQVSAINQTFFLLFGIPFVLSGILDIGIPISMDITIVMGGIFIMSVALSMMISDDNKFDLLEGIVITILSTVSLLALALIGGIASQSESTSTAIQLAQIAQLL